MNRLKMVCGNCFNYDKEKGVCTIRYTILPDESKTPMVKKPDAKGCSVFMYP